MNPLGLTVLVVVTVSFSLNVNPVTTEDPYETLLSVDTLCCQEMQNSSVALLLTLNPHPFQTAGSF